MEEFEVVNKLTGGLRHLRVREADEVVKYSVPVETVPRPGFNTTGKEVDISLNAYPITKFPSRNVYQYDVNIGSGDEKNIVCKKVWNSNARKTALKQIIYDGRKLAWSMNNYSNGLNIMVDLDAEQGRPGGRTSNAFRLVVRPTKTVNLAVLNAWLQGRAAFSESVLEALNFLDHVIREWPSGKFLAIRRSFFDENGEHKDLGNGVLAFKGVYEAIRPAINRGLIVNIDVSNTCFWARTSFLGAAMAVLDCRDHQHLMHELRPVADGHGGTTESNAFFEVHRRLKKLVVQAHYRGCPCTNVNFTVKGLINASASKYIIEIKDKATGIIEKITVEQYFKKKYNLLLTYPDLPMVEMTKKGIVYPMEYLTIHGLHKYPWKLNEYQTSQMIKYAAARPADRLNSIHKSKRMLDHSKDPVLQTFGLQIDENMIRTKARLLPNPDIQFGGNQRHNPGTNGRWDLRGKKFYQPNKQPLSCWGVGFIPGKRNAINRTQVEHFVDGFMKTYAGHGGNVTQRPLIAELTEDTGEAIKRLFNSTGNKFQREPQLLLIIVPDKNSFTYLRIKKSCDCRWGVPSQVLQSAHVAKANPQYISNVLMKVNAKLGGTTARIIPKVNDANLRPMSMIIGADVTHPTIGVWSPSMAAVSVCMDTFGGRYWGACETNGDRVEVIARANMEHMLTPLVREWMSTVGQGRAPENVYYFRDGVSEGEREKILKQEVLDMKSIFMKLTQDKWKGKFTVIIANKRHHIRAFPKPNDRNAADKNGNPLPGLLIEKDVTSPHDWDFFLYSHIALQGTSRPVHYHVILDQIGHKAHQLENMIYDHCYQYMRSTTSVSLFPAVYYAHLIAARARHHEDVPASSGPRSGREVPMTNPKPKDKPVDPRLLPIHGTPNRLPFAVWYI
ncbi:eukaryotic translation initiation factor 2c [Aspergillus bombycis]|uniref:Eukaryotic translation initiation factor 2c n=1 Tax=Aspergillus bombycis TaxID=109264 RepID=A0A1F7ZQN6_9EURO|nr:eukaryotic translation initiation factor 2c [Aspergillus bombycis]OGM41385.1 eukaryotic translation initiation factor 2c [Aspergillus bombycis]